MKNTRRLYLVRHAQAGPARPGQSDHSRVLDGQGEADAVALGRRMAARGIAPALVLCSGSARTRGTLAGLGPVAAQARIVFDDRIYEDGDDGIAVVLAEHRDTLAADDDILLIGHNPSIGNVARRWSGSGETAALEALVRGFPTSAVARLRQGDTDGWEGSHLEEMLLPPHERD